MKAEAVSTALDAALQLANNSNAGFCYHDLVYKNSLIECLTSLQAKGAPHSTYTSDLEWVLNTLTTTYKVLQHFESRQGALPCTCYLSLLKCHF